MVVASWSIHSEPDEDISDVLKVKRRNVLELKLVATGEDSVIAVIVLTGVDSELIMFNGCGYSGGVDSSVWVMRGRRIVCLLLMLTDWAGIVG